jgi:hypothetical protein
LPARRTSAGEPALLSADAKCTALTCLSISSSCQSAAAGLLTSQLSTCTNLLGLVSVRRLVAFSGGSLNESPNSSPPAQQTAASSARSPPTPRASACRSRVRLRS